MSLPGVRIGPLDPDRTAAFGQVSQRNSARQLIRIHAQAFPNALRRALALKLDEPRTKALDMAEVRAYLADLRLENGDPAVPDGSTVVGASVRGERDREQLLTYTFKVQGSGRTGKWFAPYNAVALPDSYAEGDERVRVADLRERGFVSMAPEGAPPVAAARKKTPVEAPDSASAEKDRRIAELEAELAEANERAAEAEAEAEGDAGDAGDAGDEDGEKEPGDGILSEDPPFDGYEDMKGPEVVKLLKADDTTDEERQAILDYEKTHANRRGVVGAAEVALGSRGSAE